MTGVRSDDDFETSVAAPTRHFGNKIFITTSHSNSTQSKNYRLTPSPVHTPDDERRSDKISSESVKAITDRYLNALDIKEAERARATRHSKAHSLQSKQPTILSSMKETSIEGLDQGSFRSPPKREPSVKKSGSLNRSSSTSSSRKGSIARKRRNRISAAAQIRTRLFPLNAKQIGEHHQRRVKKGKYRNARELDAYLDYVNNDAAMSRELVMNQSILTFSVSNKELLKFEPTLKAVLKSITVDSKDNYILYSPIDQTSRNSLVSLFEDQIMDLFNVYPDTTTSPKTAQTPSTPRCAPKRYPPSHAPSSPSTLQSNPNSLASMEKLKRANSLPLSFRNQRCVNLQRLWKIYYKQIIIRRIQFRLRNTITSHCSQALTEDASDVQSIDTDFFVSHDIRNRSSQLSGAGGGSDAASSSRRNPVAVKRDNYKRRTDMSTGVEFVRKDIESVISRL